jgi:hypothetical protein
MTTIEYPKRGEICPDKFEAVKDDNEVIGIRDEKVMDETKN